MSSFDVSTFEGPAWNNKSEYPGIESNELSHDKLAVEHLLEKIEKTLTVLKPTMARVLQGDPTLLFADKAGLISGLQGLAELEEQTQILVANLNTYAQCEMSVDAKNDAATKLYSETQILAARLDAATKPISLFLDRAPENLVTQYLDHPHTRPHEFQIRHGRKLSDTLLSENEETLIATLRLHGLNGWGNLYDQISGNLICHLKYEDGRTESMGLAQASGLLRDPLEAHRQAAWHGIQEAWQAHEQAGAATLNGLAGWRLDINKKRSHTRGVHFLDFPLHSARIQRETLEAMFEAVHGEIEVARRALRAIARGLGKNKADPWDLLCPAPSDGKDNRRTFKQAVQLLHDAFHSVDPLLSDFVDTMEKNWWIEGRVLPTKRQGAYMTDFAKSRTPRVFLTYMGSLDDVGTIAHEVGHAFHSWVMRDLPYSQTFYPMTLAETASVFAETALADQLAKNGDARVRFDTAWNNASAAAAFLLNIPTRFEFEKNFYDRRQKGFVSPHELGDLMSSAFDKWYGDTLSIPERQFWITKLHFSIAGTSFYNFPYTFGYLFSLGIYARRSELGAGFMSSYVSLLRDTGRMTAEELAQKHLGEDITKPEFWKKSLAIVAGQVAEFERILSAH
jgi:oligoendopeptidase F